MMKSEKSSNDNGFEKYFFNRMYTVKLAYIPLCECVLYVYLYI